MTHNAFIVPTPPPANAPPPTRARYGTPAHMFPQALWHTHVTALAAETTSHDWTMYNPMPYYLGQRGCQPRAAIARAAILLYQVPSRRHKPY